jgi:hypothetical protein
MDITTPLPDSIGAGTQWRLMDIAVPLADGTGTSTQVADYGHYPSVYLTA